jgi:hypothetical protein
VGSRRDCKWILGLSGFRVVAMAEAESDRLTIRIERRGVRRYACSGCGRRTGRVRSIRERTWDDLPWPRITSPSSIAATNHLSDVSSRSSERSRPPQSAREGARSERVSS